jgi:hypothetical protein
MLPQSRSGLPDSVEGDQSTRLGFQGDRPEDLVGNQNVNFRPIHTVRALH